MNDPDDRPRPLWAPWRIDYIRRTKPDGCFLCEKGASNDDQRNCIIARGPSTFLLLNTYPYNSGHVLITPLRHCADLTDLTANERAELLEMAVHMERVLRTAMNPDGFNFGFNLGAAAGAGLKEHVHGHLVPRWAGDTNFMPVLSGTDVVPEALHETTQLLRETWRRDPQAVAFTQSQPS